MKRYIALKLEIHKGESIDEFGKRIALYRQLLTDCYGNNWKELASKTKVIFLIRRSE